MNLTKQTWQLKQHSSVIEIYIFRLFIMNFHTVTGYIGRNTRILDKCYLMPNWNINTRPDVGIYYTCDNVVWLYIIVHSVMYNHEAHTQNSDKVIINFNRMGGVKVDAQNYRWYYMEISLLIPSRQKTSPLWLGVDILQSDICIPCANHRKIKHGLFSEDGYCDYKNKNKNKQYLALNQIKFLTTNCGI